jgi:hypothetical protein
MFFDQAIKDAHVQQDVEAQRKGRQHGGGGVVPEMRRHDAW